MIPGVLTSGQVAVRLGVARATVTRYAKDGTLPSFRTPGGHYRFKEEDIDRIANTLREVQ